MIHSTSWRQAALREICTRISSGGTPSRRHPEYFSLTEGHPWLKSQELLDRRINMSEEKITNLGLENSSAKYYPQNTILMAMYGANVGQLGLLSRPATVNQAICGLCVDPQIADFVYVFYALLHLRSGLTVQAMGAAQQNLNQELIRNFQIPLPNLAVQQRIASILSAYDDLIENNTRRIQILEEMAQAIYREWFVEFRFPGHEDVRMVDSELGPIPERWRWSELREHAREVRSGVDPTGVPANTPYFGLEHMPERSIAICDWGKADDVSSRKYRFDLGDILFGKIRPYFHKVGIPPVEGICSTDAIVIRPADDRDAGLVLATVSSPRFVQQAVQTSQGTKMPRANWKVLERYPVPIPADPLLVAQFNTFILDSVRLIHVLVMANRNLRASRDLLLPRLISGEIDVSNLDIGNAEPAA